MFQTNNNFMLVSKSQIHFGVKKRTGELSPKLKQVEALLSENKSTKQIARTLKISIQTAIQHVKEVKIRTGIIPKHSKLGTSQGTKLESDLSTNDPAPKFYRLTSPLTSDEHQCVSAFLIGIKPDEVGIAPKKFSDLLLQAHTKLKLVSSAEKKAWGTGTPNKSKLFTRFNEAQKQGIDFDPLNYGKGIDFEA